MATLEFMLSLLVMLFALAAIGAYEEDKRQSRLLFYAGMAFGVAALGLAFTAGRMWF